MSNIAAEIQRLRYTFKIPDSVSIIPGVKIYSDIAKKKVSKPSEKFEIDNTDNRDAAIAVSALNTPVYTNIEFGEGRYESEIDDVFIEFPSLKFNTVLVNVSRPKIIERTEVQGKDGAIKEYIGKGDWIIQVDGIIDGKNGSYPINEVADLMKMLDAPVSVDIISTYLQNLGIVSAVVIDHNFPQEVGSYSSQAFQITLESDIPTELRISDSDV